MRISSYVFIVQFLFTCVSCATSESLVLSWQPESLLLASNDDPFFFEFDLSEKDRDISEYREIYHGYNLTSAVTYDYTTVTLFWSGTVTNTPERSSHILSTVNNSGVINTLHTSSSGIKGLAVDRERQLLFFTKGWDSNTVNVMSTSGENLQNLGNVRNNCFMSPFDLALDTEHRMIYVACYYRLINMTYGGGNKQQMDGGNWIYGVDFDQDTGTLYYNENKYIYTRNPTGSPSFESYMNYLSSQPTSIKRYGDYLFISFLEENDIRVINLKTGIEHRITNIPSDNYHRWTLAYIPCRYGNFNACRLLQFGQHLMKFVRRGQELE